MHRPKSCISGPTIVAPHDPNFFPGFCNLYGSLCSPPQLRLLSSLSHQSGLFEKHSMSTYLAWLITLGVD